tara:strand:+ start:406 stop:1395 length:990 start_codon:yes stop_codon:yes gene_type:complete
MILKVLDLKKNLNNNKIFLFHGANDGYKEEILENLFKPIFGNNVFKYFEKDIFSNTESFYSEILSKSFFEKNKLIIIKEATDKLRDEIEIFKEKELDETVIVLMSNILDKRSKLRVFFEKEEDLISIAFYSDTNETLFRITKSFFLEKKIPVSQESINLIVSRANGERKNLINELKKIENYLSSKKKISIDEIYTLTNLTENYNFNELVDNCLAKNKKKTIYILNENNFSLDDVIIIIRTFLIKSKRLLKLTKNFQANKNLNQTISVFKPPIFWKDKKLVEQQLKYWSVDKTYELISDINKIEMNIKKNSFNSLNILNDFILNTSQTNN